MEEFHNEDDNVNLRNMVPLNKNHVLELADGSNNEPLAKKLAVS
jgi:hypothetical protein